MNIIEKDGVTIIRTGARIDANTAPELNDAVKDLEFKKLVLDLSDTQYISSAALRAFMLCKDRATALGAEVSIENAAPIVQNVMNMSGFSKIF